MKEAMITKNVRQPCAIALIANCKKPPKCVNCYCKHAYGSKDCQQKTLRKEINTPVYRENMTWPEAEIRAKAKIQGNTFAQHTRVRASKKSPETNHVIKSTVADAAL